MNLVLIAHVWNKDIILKPRPSLLSPPNHHTRSLWTSLDSLLIILLHVTFSTSLPTSPHPHNNPTSAPLNILLSARSAPISISVSSPRMFVLNRSSYLAKGYCQLADRSIYQHLSYDPTPTFNSELSARSTNQIQPPYYHISLWLP